MGRGTFREWWRELGRLSPAQQPADDVVGASRLIWYGDGTEIRTGECRLHLASVLDMGSRRVLGFALSEHHDAQLAYGALAVAVRGGQVPGAIMHSDYAELCVKPRDRALACVGGVA
jgi:transposase InsO family protein